MEVELQQQLGRVLSAVERLLPIAAKPVDWGASTVAVWRRHAMSGVLEAVPPGDGVDLDDLLGIERQKETLIANTRQFLAGFPASNALLWGTRGTGKSSLVRALLKRYGKDGLRLIQVDKSDMVNLPDIIESLRQQPFRFIIFGDDVSFETGEPGYKILKSVLDGSVYPPAENVLIYVTSNRRHLLPEYESDNRGAMMVNNEIHHGEAIEEKISLSNRFALWIGFHPFTQEQYLEVARAWTEKVALRYGFSFVWSGDAAREAIDWSHVKGEKSGRAAWQFANQFVGREMLKVSGR